MVSWRREGQQKYAPDRKPFFLSGTLVSIGSVVSFPRVGHGVGQKFLANLQSNFLQQKIPENRSFRGFLELLPRFELGTSSLPTDWEGEVCCFPGLLCPLLSGAPCSPALFRPLVPLVRFAVWVTVWVSSNSWPRQRRRSTSPPPRSFGPR